MMLGIKHDHLSSMLWDLGSLPRTCLSSRVGTIHLSPGILHSPEQETKERREGDEVSQGWQNT